MASDQPSVAEHLVDLVVDACYALRTHGKEHYNEDKRFLEHCMENIRIYAQRKASERPAPGRTENKEPSV